MNRFKQVIEQALEEAARLLGADRSRGYCLEMICADFLEGARLEGGNPEVLYDSLCRSFRFLSPGQQQRFFACVRAAA